MALEDSGGVSTVLGMTRSPLAPLKKGGTISLTVFLLTGGTILLTVSLLTRGTVLLPVSLFTEGTILLTVSLLTGGTILLPVSLFMGGIVLLTVSLLMGGTILLKVPLFKGDLGRSSTFCGGKNDCSDSLLSPVAVKLPTLSFPPSPRLPVSPSGTPETGTD
jgi:hypothetical protein